MASARVFGACGRALMAAAKGPASGGATKPKTTASSGATTAKRADSPRTTPSNAGIQKVVPVSPQLSNFLGAPQVSRTGAVKKVWEYIKLHNLQNPSNKREIFCDEKLKTIFDGKDRVGFTEIAKLLQSHFAKSG